MAATEDDQNFEELCLLRQLAMNEVKQQRELAEVNIYRYTGSCVCVVYNYVITRLLNQEPRSSFLQEGVTGFHNGFQVGKREVVLIDVKWGE